MLYERNKNSSFSQFAGETLETAVSYVTPEQGDMVGFAENALGEKIVQLGRTFSTVSRTNSISVDQGEGKNNEGKEGEDLEQNKSQEEKDEAAKKSLCKERTKFFLAILLSGVIQYFYVCSTIQPIANSGAGSENLLFNGDCAPDEPLCYSAIASPDDAWKFVIKLFFMYCSFSANYRTILYYGPLAAQDLFNAVTKKEQRTPRLILETALALVFSGLSLIATYVLNKESVDIAEHLISSSLFFFDVSIVIGALLITIATRFRGTNSLKNLVMEEFWVWVGVDHLFKHLKYEKLAEEYHNKRILSASYNHLSMYVTLVPSDIREQAISLLNSGESKNALELLYKGNYLGNTKKQWAGLLKAAKTSALAKFAYYFLVVILGFIAILSYPISYFLTKKAVGSGWFGYLAAAPNTCFYLNSFISFLPTLIQEFFLTLAIYQETNKLEIWLGFLDTLIVSLGSSLNLLQTAISQKEEYEKSSILTFLFGKKLVNEIYKMIGANISFGCNFIPLSRIRCIKLLVSAEKTSEATNDENNNERLDPQKESPQYKNISILLSLVNKLVQHLQKAPISENNKEKTGDDNIDSQSVKTEIDSKKLILKIVNEIYEEKNSQGSLLGFNQFFSKPTSQDVYASSSKEVINPIHKNAFHN